MTRREFDVDAKEVCLPAAILNGRCERVLPLSGAIAELLVDWRQQFGTAESDAVLPWPFDTFNPLYDGWRQTSTRFESRPVGGASLKRCGRRAPR